MDLDDGDMANAWTVKARRKSGMRPNAVTATAGADESQGAARSLVKNEIRVY